MFDRLIAYLDSIHARDPAPRSRWEILIYPGVWAVGLHRAAHWLFEAELYFAARLVNHVARFLTAIDIHPGAKIGRNLFIDSDGVWEFDPFVQQAVSSASLVRGRNWQQTSNNVEYHSPVFHGLDVQGQYSFGNQPGNFNAGAPGEFGRSNGIMLSYHSPLFDLRGIYDELRDSEGRLSNIFTASREYFVGANVRMQKFKIQAAYTHY